LIYPNSFKPAPANEIKKMNSTMRKATCDFYKIFLVLILFATIAPSALADTTSTTGNGASTSTDANMTPSQTMKFWGYRNPSGLNFAATQYGGADRLVPANGAGGLTGGAAGTATGGVPGAGGSSSMLKSDGPGTTTPYGIIQSWPVTIPPMTAQVPTWRDTAITKNLLPTYGFPVSDSQFQMIQRFNDNIMIEELSNPERLQWLMGTMGQQMATGTGDSAGQAASNQTQNAIEFSRRYLVNFTSDGTNEWNTMRNQLFVPIAILLLLPGAVLAQVRAIVAQGYYTIFGEINPFEGILRSIIAVFLIPATYLVVNYGIDVSNSLALTVAQGYTNIFGTNMYEDAKCLQRRSAAVNPPERNDNAIVNSENPNANQSGGTWPGQWEAQTHTTRQFDPCAGKDTTTVTNESMSDARATNRLIMNLMNATMGSGWLIMCAFQVVFLLYLFVMGPIVAALWVWPINALRQALPSWIEGVCKLCFWSFLWNVVILLMACFRGYGEDGMAVASALNALANLAVLSGFDFSSLISNAAGYLQQAVSSAGGSGGSSTGSQSGSGVGKASSSATGQPSGSSRGGAGGGRGGGRTAAGGARPGAGGLPGGALGAGGPNALPGGAVGAGAGALGGAKGGLNQATGVPTLAGSTTNTKGMPTSVTAPGNVKGGPDPGVPGSANTQGGAGGPHTGTDGSPPLTGANGLPLGQGGVNPEASFLASHPGATSAQMGDSMKSHVDPQSQLGQYLQQHPDQAAGAAGYLATHPNIGENQLGQALAGESAKGNQNPTVGQLDKDLHQVSSPDLANKTLGGPDSNNLAHALDSSGLMGTNHPAGVTMDNAAMVANPQQFEHGATAAGAVDGLNGAKLVDQNGQDMSKYFDSTGHLSQALPPGEHVSALDPKSGQTIGTFDPNAANGQGHWNGSAPGVGLDANGHWAKDGLNSPLVYDGKANGFEVAGVNGAPSGIAVDSATGNLKMEGSQAPVTADNMGHFYSTVNGQAMAYDGNAWSAQSPGTHSGIESSSQFSWDANSQHMTLNGSNGSVMLDNSGGAGSHLAMTGSGAPVAVDQAGGLHTQIGNTDFSRDANSQTWTAAGQGGQYNWDAGSQHMALNGSNGSVFLDTNAAGGAKLEMSGTHAPVSVDNYGRVGTDVGGQHFTLDGQSGTWSSSAAPNQNFSWDGNSQHMNLSGTNGSVYLDTAAAGGARLEMSGTNAPVQVDQSGNLHTHVGNTDFTRDANSQNWTAAGTGGQYNWDSGSQHMALSGTNGSVYLDTSGSGGAQHLAMSGSGAPVSVDQSGAMHTHVGNTDFTRDANSQNWTAAGTGGQYNWDSGSQHMALSGSNGSVYLDTSGSSGGQHLAMSGSGAPITVDQSGAMHSHIGNTDFTRDANSQNWTSSAAPGQQFTWDGAQSRMELAGTQGSVYMDTSGSAPRLEMAGNNAPVQIDQSGNMHTHIGNTDFSREAGSQNWTSAAAPNQSFSWDGAQSRMEVAGTQGSVFMDTSGSAPRLEMASANGQVQPVQVDQSGAMHTHIGNADFTRDASSQAWTSASAPNQSFNWNSEQNHMVANGSQGAVYYDQATNRTEMAGTNTPVSLDSSGSYHTQIGSANFVENSAGNWTSQSAPNQSFTWNAEHQQMIASGSQGQVYYDQATNRTEMVGSNAPVTSDAAGQYSAHIGNSTFVENSAGNWTTQSAPNQSFSWNNEQHQMVANNSQGQVYYDQAAGRAEMVGSNAPVTSDSAGNYSAHIGNSTFVENSAGSWAAQSAPNQSFSWNNEQHQMVANNSQGQVYYDQATGRAEIAGSNIPVTSDGSGHYSAQIGNSTFVENSAGSWTSQSAPNQSFSWNNEQHQMVANNSNGAVYYDQATNRTELAGTHTPVTYENGHYYESNSNHHVMLDQSSNQLVAQSNNFSGSVPLASAPDNSGNYAVANSGGQLTYNPSSDVINVASNPNVQASPTPSGDYVASTTYGGQQVVLPADSNQFYTAQTQTPVQMTDQGWAPVPQQPAQTTYNDYSAPIVTSSYSAPGDSYTPTPVSYTPPSDSYTQTPSGDSSAQYAANLQHQQEAAQRMAEAQAAQKAAEANAGYTNNQTYSEVQAPPVHYDNPSTPAPPEPPSRGLNSLVMGTLPVASRPANVGPTKAPNQEVAANDAAPQEEPRSTNESLQEQMARLQKRGSGYQPTQSQQRAWHRKYGRPWSPEDGEIEEV
jgi:hypothetical protein